MDKEKIIKDLFYFSSYIRYVAVYEENELKFERRAQTMDGSSADTDRFEELLVNPTLITLARQRGNIDCGGLDHITVGYGNFNQLIKETPKGHLSVCLEKSADLNQLPYEIFDFIEEHYPQLIVKS